MCNHIYIRCMCPSLQTYCFPCVSASPCHLPTVRGLICTGRGRLTHPWHTPREGMLRGNVTACEGVPWIGSPNTLVSSQKAARKVVPPGSLNGQRWNANHWWFFSIVVGHMERMFVSHKPPSFGLILVIVRTSLLFFLNVDKAPPIAVETFCLWSCLLGFLCSSPVHACWIKLQSLSLKAITQFLLLLPYVAYYVYYIYTCKTILRYTYIVNCKYTLACAFIYRFMCVCVSWNFIHTCSPVDHTALKRKRNI